jgi:hypothetical protein
VNHPRKKPQVTGTFGFALVPGAGLEPASLAAGRLFAATEIGSSAFNGMKGQGMRSHANAHASEGATTYLVELHSMASQKNLAQ